MNLQVGHSLHGITITRFQPADESLPHGVQRIEYRSAYDGATDWALLWPPASGDAWAVCLHGHGATGNQFFTRPDIRDHQLSRIRGEGWGVLSPHLRGNSWMGPAAVHDLSGLISTLRGSYRARPIILVGGSMGGTGVVAFSAMRPAEVDATIAFCPATDIALQHASCDEQSAKAVPNEIARAIEKAYGGTPAEQPALYAAHSALRNAAKLTMPLFICHGAGDSLIPVEQPRQLATALKDLPTFRYYEQPNGDHGTPLVEMDAAMTFILPLLKSLSR